MRRYDDTARPDEIRDAEQLVETLRWIDSLPPAAQRDLAEADRLDAEFTALEASGEYERSRQAALRQLEIRRLHLGERHPEVATGLHHLGISLWRLGRYPAADSTLRQTLSMRRQLLGDEHPAIATTQDDLGRLLWYHGKNDEAERLFRDALALRRRLLGERHPDVATSQHNLGLLLHGAGKTETAEAHLRQALALRRQLFAGDHLDIASSLINLGILLRDRGEYVEAEFLLREELAMRRRLKGPEHPEVADSMENLGLILMYGGNYGDAEPLLREALAMHRRLLGRSHPEVASSLDNLGFLLLQQGNYAEAEPLFREALDLRRELLGERHHYFAKSLHNLGLALWDLEQQEEAEQLLRQAVAINREIRGNEHIEVTAMLHNLGLFLWDQGDLAGAETLIRDELEINRRILGRRHPDVILSLINLAGVLMDRGRLIEPAAHLREALSMSAEVLGTAHPYQVSALTGLGAILERQDDKLEAEALLERASITYEAARRRAGAGMVRSTFQQSPYNRLAAARLELGRSAAAWEAVESHLGRTLAELLTASGGRAFDATEAARQDSLEESLGRLEGQLEILQEAALSDTTQTLRRAVAETRDELLGVEAKWSEFQRSMLRRYPITEGHAYNIERVQARLTQQSAILGWLDVELPGGDAISWGYVIRHEGQVEWRRLPSTTDRAAATSPFEQSHRFREQLTRAATQRFRARPGPQLNRASHALWRERIAPLADLLDGVASLVVIPSGAMLGIPLEALVDERQEFLGQTFAVSYAPSATIFAWLREQTGVNGLQPSGVTEGRHLALLVGDPRLQESVESPESPETEAAGDATHPLLGAMMLRSAIAGNRLALEALRPLPWTRVEIEGVAATLESATILLGSDASEMTLDDLARSGELGKFGTIHLATHALVDNDRPERSALVLSQIGLPDRLAAAMAGERVFDGLLTAEEIVRDWQLNADLVTLSACETALGREAGGEGYIGFVHSFLQAGARSLLVSLWPVHDEATALLMRRFHEIRRQQLDSPQRDNPGTRLSKAGALREAKTWLRGYADAEGHRPFAHPYYWAGFILFGDSEWSE